MSGRKRHARHDPSDPMHWNKEQYIHHLKEMGISVKSTWRLDMMSDANVSTWRLP
jgi:hypothetical protein